MPTSVIAPNDARSDTVAAPDEALSLRIGAFFVALCLFPRVLMCVFADSVCRDAFFYFDRAAAFEQGDLKDAFSGGMNLNLYPAILAALHRCGLEWIAGARLWNLVVTALTVLPLYGWVRRVTDGRTATLGCVVYAFWPFMVESAADPIRDATFWLLLNLTFYLGMVTVDRPTPGKGLVTALVWVAALITRMEGWLLLLPLSWWVVGKAMQSAGRTERCKTGDEYTQSADARRTLLRACGLCVVTVLLLGTAVNLTVGRKTGTWITGRVETALPGVPWLHNLLHGKPAPAAGERIVSFIEPTTLHSFSRNFAEGMDPLNLAGLLLGLACGRHLFRNRTMQPLLAHAAVMLLAIWCRVPDQRYFCQVYFVLIPFVATGALLFIDTVGGWLSRRYGRDLLIPWTVAWLSVFATIGTVDAVTTWHPDYVNNHRLADWFRQQYPSGAQVVSDRACLAPRFYMTGPQPGEPHVSHRNVKSIVTHSQPDVVVFSPEWNPPASCETMNQELARHNYGQLDLEAIGVTENAFIVWVKQQSGTPPLSAVSVRAASHDSSESNRK